MLPIPELNVKLTQGTSFPDGTVFYPDYQNGEYGFNTDPNRGADTFRPFKQSNGCGNLVSQGGYIVCFDVSKCKRMRIGNQIPSRIYGYINCPDFSKANSSILGYVADDRTNIRDNFVKTANGYEIDISQWNYISTIITGQTGPHWEPIFE